MSHGDLHRTGRTGSNRLSHECLHGGKVDRFVDQNIGAFGHLRHGLQRSRVTGECNRSVGKVESNPNAAVTGGCCTTTEVTLTLSSSITCPTFTNFVQFDRVEPAGCENPLPKIRWLPWRSES